MARAAMLAFWLGVGPIREALVPDYVLEAPLGQESTALKATVPYLLFNLLFVLVRTPLQVASVRLSLQKYQDAEAATGLRADSDNSRRDRASEEPVAGIRRYSNEDVIVLKDTYRFPYTGLLDCLNTIINEEGWKTLMKSGWLTLLGM
ncbi:hypothetical protein AAF712_002957 [Marasmius tenuissimus]|uniref:Uncharacterized protein n=1 Tax=Marasmius tenuissimus TaxID=585030 RepID=A0ABR3A969_9AGAR